MFFNVLVLILSTAINVSNNHACVYLLEKHHNKQSMNLSKTLKLTDSRVDSIQDGCHS